MSIDLRLGDALAPEGLGSLADGSIGCTISDPPFDQRTHRCALEVRTGGKRSMAGQRAVALPFPPLEGEQLDQIAGQIVRVTRRWIVLFCADRQIEAWASALETHGARFVRAGQAWRTNPRPQFSGDRPGTACDHLVIAHAGTGAMRWHGGGKPAVWRSGVARYDFPDNKQPHPTAKPLALMRSLVGDFSDAGDLVLDPFAGSGTTAAACKQLGRGFIGWERDATYHAIAVARLLAVAPAGKVDPAEVALLPERLRKASTSPEKASTGAARLCEHCTMPLAEDARAHARYHRSCRELAYRGRKRALDGEAA